MVELRIFLNAESMLEEEYKAKREFIDLKTPLKIGALEGGMKSGKHSISFGFTLPDGRVVFAETSMKLFHTAAKLFAQKFGWQDDGSISFLAIVDGQNRGPHGGSTEPKARN